MSVFQGWVALLGAVLLLFGLLPHDLADQVAIEGVIALGAIGLWRWGWGGVHLLRAYLYRRLVFPRLRAEAETVRLPPAVYVIVTSYRIEPDMNAAVYRRLLAGVAAMGVPARIVACVTDPADAQVLGAAFTATADLPEGTTLDLLVQDGTGKRAAMADALALVMRLRPPPHAQLVLMDGDTLLNPGDLSRSCRFLAAYADVGAVTTDNRPLVKGSVLTREWYRLRMAQRDVLMSSMALSGRVLVLTGRFSVMRMEVARLPDFAQAVAHDSIVHWRLGPIQMLTGDDKSSWFVVLKAGWKMLYLPDVRVDCAEELPPGGWWRSTSALMLRWYGNMARNNGRSLALGPRRIGWFTWLCLLDQRIAPGPRWPARW
jgi:glycosyltransferase Alg8